MSLEEELDKAQSKIATTIKIAMLDKGFTQSELARLMNVSRSAISLAVSGATNPKSVELRKKIYKILGIK